MANMKTIKEKAAAADAQQNTGGLMTKKVNAAIQVMLTNKVNPNQAWQCILVVDRSGSMSHEYRDGSVQDAVDRTLGFSVIVDDDGEVPTIFFDHQIEEKLVKLTDFHQYVKRSGITARGSTDLALALKHVAEITGNGDLFANGGGGFMKRGGGAPKPSIKPMQTPAFVTIVTDGSPNDRNAATDVIRRLSYRAVFLKFIFVGNDRGGWAYLESLDDDIPVGVDYDKGGRLIDNVDAKQLASLGGTSDNAFYEAMLDEVPTYLAAAKQKGLIAA